MPGLSRSGNWNENDVNTLSRINWRASLVPAAAVIPAPIAYIKVVAVKKLWHLVVGLGTAIIYCEEIRVFKAGLGLEYISME